MELLEQSIEEYHASAQVCSSEVKQALLSCLHWRTYRGLTGTDRAKQSQAQRMGSAFHSLMEGQEVFDATYYVGERPAGNTLAGRALDRLERGENCFIYDGGRTGKAWKAEVERVSQLQVGGADALFPSEILEQAQQTFAECHGRQWISPGDSERVMTMSSQLQSSQAFAQVMGEIKEDETPYKEISAYVGNERVRPDLWWPENRVIVDYKSIAELPRWHYDMSDGDLRAALRRVIVTWGYHISAAMYKKLLSASYFVLAFVERNPPFDTAVVLLSEDILSEGEELYEAGLENISRYREEKEPIVFGRYAHLFEI